MLPELMVDDSAVNSSGVARLIFSNPEKFNAISFEMWQDIPRKFQALDADPAVRVIILEGQGDKAFAAGADISKFEGRQHEPEHQAQHDRAVEMAYLAPLNCSKPVIAKIHGICMGGGLGMAAACDLRFCADNARFRMPAARLGLGYNQSGIARFIQTVGIQNTFDIFYSARLFGAVDAKAMGFMFKVLPGSELDSAVFDYAKQVAGNAPLTLRAMKLTTQALLSPDPSHTQAMVEAITACGASRDHAEGARAFLEKREPVFLGR